MVLVPRGWFFLGLDYLVPLCVVFSQGYERGKEGVQRDVCPLIYIRTHAPRTTQCYISQFLLYSAISFGVISFVLIYFILYFFKCALGSNNDRSCDHYMVMFMCWNSSLYIHSLRWYHLCFPSPSQSPLPPQIPPPSLPPSSEIKK